MVERCKGTNVAGEPCGAQAIRDGWCAWHDPQRKAEMTEARRRGGQARSNQQRARKELTSAAMSPADRILEVLDISLKAQNGVTHAA